MPTYNERDNVPRLCRELSDALAPRWDYEIIIVDDNSPDGTAEVVRALSKEDPRVRLVSRPGKLGLGSAVVEGFQASTGQDWVMMDADLSHRPQDVPKLLDGLRDADVVVGSRYVKGGGSRGWSFIRVVISRVAGAVARLMLGLRVKDVTSGFAAFRRGSVEPLLGSLSPRGFKLLLEILAKGTHLKVSEAPITFVPRAAGASKMGLNETLIFLRLCWRLRSQRAASSSRS